MEKKTHQLVYKIKSLARGGFFHILSANFISKAITMISSILIVRIVSKEDYAYLAYADNLYSYILLISGCGLSSALLKYSSSKGNTHDTNLAYHNYSLLVGGGFTLLVSLGLCLVVSIAPVPFEESRKYVYVLALYPLLYHLYTNGSYFIRTYYRNREYAQLGVGYAAVLTVSGILLALAFGVTGLVLARYFTLVLAGAYLFLLTRRITQKAKARPLHPAEKKKFWVMGLSLMMAELFSGMMPLNEAFLINNLIKDSAVTANFRVASLLPQMLLLVTGALAVYLFPIVSDTKDTRNARKLVIRFGILNFATILFLSVMGVIFTPLVIRLLYGTRYSDAATISYALWGLRGLNAALRVLPMNMLPAIGKPRPVAVIALLSTVVQLLIDYFAIQHYGIFGVAIGGSIVYLMSGIAYWYIFLGHCKRTESSEGGSADGCNN